MWAICPNSIKRYEKRGYGAEKESRLYPSIIQGSTIDPATLSFPPSRYMIMALSPGL